MAFTVTRTGNTAANYPTNPGGKRTKGSEFIAQEDRFKFFRMRKGGFTRQGKRYPNDRLDLKRLDHLEPLTSQVVKSLGCIAGSAVAFSLLGEFDKAGDIDIFCFGEREFLKIIENLSFSHFERDYDNMPWGDSIDTNEWHKVPFVLFKPGFNTLGINKNIQVCKLVYYDNDIDVVNSFDLTCAQFAVNHYDFTTSKWATDDLLARRLNSWNVHDLTSFASRLEKYEARGFSMGSGRSADLFKPAMVPERVMGGVPLPTTHTVVNTQAKPLDLWDLPEYRSDYNLMDPADFKRKWG